MTSSVAAMRFSGLSAVWMSLLLAGAAIAAPSPNAPDYVEHYDTLYNSLTVEKRGSIVELRARSRRGEYLESAVDLRDPLRLVVAYTRSLYAALFVEPEPKRVLMIGLGGAGFHRVFAHAFPDALLQSVELDAKVLELAKSHLGFVPTEKTPVAIMDGRLYVKRNRETWDWIVLDAFRGGFVPPHLKTREFYQECADRLSDRGVFVTNLHTGTRLFYADLRTLRAVFPQVVLFHTKHRGNVIALAVKYSEPDISQPASWPDPERLTQRLGGAVNMADVAAEHMPFPETQVRSAELLTDDFAPVEFLNVLENNNSGETR